MKTTRILKNAIKNGGATLTSKLKGAPLQYGYMVSFRNYEKIENINNMKALKKILKSYIKLAKKMRCYIGLWIEENKMYFDLSTHFYSLEVAQDFGRVHKQKAIYNIKENKSIYL